jgi:N-acetylneuraminic acid mutarotase
MLFAQVRLLRYPPARLKYLIALIPLIVLVASCGGGGGGGGTLPAPKTYTAESGVAQKGPLITGSTVTAQELDSSLSPTGKQYSYQISSDLGTFSPTSTFGSQYIGLNATGYYFDEVQDTVSSGTVTLNGYNDLSADGVLNVNILTTLAYQRINNLIVNSSMTFAAARVRAEGEVLTALNIPVKSYGAFGTLDLSGNTDGDHILAAISSLFVYGNPAGQLSVLINNFQNDLGTHGVLVNAATKTALAAAAKAVNPVTIAAHFNQRYASLGVKFTATDITDWIDQDGDGIVGKFKFQVPDAAPSTSFDLPTFVVDQVAGTPLSVTAGQLTINGTPSTGTITVNTGDVVAVSPGAAAFSNGVLNVYVLSGSTKTVRVSFVSGLLSIAITPAAPSLAKGLTEQFTATGTFSDASTADLTGSVTWTSSTPSAATVNGAGLAQSVAAGSTTITATSGSVSGSAMLTVTAAVLESFAITPSSPSTGIGLTRQLMAVGTYSDGTTANVTSLANWTSSAPTVATVGGQTGLTTGVSLGSTNISAAIGSPTENVSLAIVSNAWSGAAPLAHGRAGHTATLLASGKALVVGGRDGPSPTASVEIYDPATDTWSQAASLPTATASHTTTLLSNGKVLVAGGVGTGPPTNDAEIYDPIANKWTQAASMLSERINHTATLLPNGKVLIAGGSFPQELASAELYDPVADTWTYAANLLAPCALHTATLLANGKVLVAGGQTIVSNAPALATGGEVYDPTANTWTATANLSDPRSEHTATLLPTGLVLVAGGVDATEYALSAELYDPLTNAWSTGGSLLTARAIHTATLLANGKVLLAGGISPNPPPGVTMPTNSAELYDPSSNTSSATGSMVTARGAHTATLLSNGVPLVVGGQDTSGAVLASSELYF